MTDVHGEMEVVSEGDVVHTYPSGGFNEAGVKKFRQEVIIKAPKDKAWILFAHPKDKTGLTPEAVLELEKSFIEYEKLGCIAIAIEVSLVYSIVIQTYAIESLRIPCMVSQDKDELLRFIQRKEKQCLSQLLI